MIQDMIDLFSKKQTMDAPDFEIYNYSDSQPSKVFPHQHNFYEIFYLLSDQLDYVIGNQEYHMQKGDFLLLPPGLLHYPSDMHIRSGNNYSRIVLWCDIGFFENFVRLDQDLNYMWEIVLKNNSYHIHASFEGSSLLLDQLKRLIIEQKRSSFVSKAMEYSILMEIFVVINRIINETQNFGTHGPAANLFSNVINYIHAHLSDELSLNTLSRHFFVSKGYISRIFREYMGIPVHQYILLLRLDGCRKAIKNGSPITETIEMYGFHDYSSFYRAFKEAFHVSPREYQNASADDSNDR